MKGRTNSKLESIKGEKLNINLITNQSDHSDLIGATITVKYADLTITEVWNGSIITIEVPAYVDYTVSVSTVSGYSQPDSYNGTAVPNNSLPLTFTYVAGGLKVNILSNLDNDTTISSVKVKVYKKNFTTNITYELLGEIGNEEVLNIPFTSSIIVKIEFPEVEGYKKPDDVEIEYNGSFAEYTGTYKCELLTVNVTADSGSVSGFEVTISKQETVGVATKYTRLEYIQSSGTQYIDTGFKPKYNTRVVTEIEGLGTGQGFVFGAKDENSATAAMQYALYRNSATTIRSDYFGTNKSLSISDASSRTVVDFNKNVVSLYGSTITNTAVSSGSCQNTLYLFALNSSAGILYPGSFKMYSCKIYDNGTLVRDYIPALRSDGITGLYDAVNDTFTVSIGNSNFIAGSKSSVVISTQTSVTGSYKIPFDVSYTVQASKVSGYTTPTNVTRVASAKSYTVTQQYTLITEIDLSLQDIYGNPINRSTANCYVVREAGTYKFPLVYGNAIKNGQVNTAAFTNNGGSYSHDFIDGSGNIITTPYIDDIEKVLSASCWVYDTDSIISNVRLIEGEICRFIQFDVNDVPSEGANAIIAAGYGDASLWSWHIWLWPHDLSPVEITNSTGVKYNIMPVNLASKYDSDGIHIKNWFYQWGRPNPLLLPSAYNSTTNHDPGHIFITSKAYDVSYGVCNPAWFYYNSSSPYNWFGDKSYYNLWDAACTGTGNSDNDTVKTVYDPCPVGWKIPNGNTFTGLSIISSANGIVKMARYSGDTTGVEFPLSGYRSYSDGSLYYVGSYGYVWLSSAGSQSYAYYLYFESGDVYPQFSYYRAYGFSVRPVEDASEVRENIAFSISGGYHSDDSWSCTALSGMTFNDWVKSSLNTDGFSIGTLNSVSVILAPDGYPLTTNKMSGSSSYWISPSTQLTAGAVYYVSTSK